jgi:isoleucyl-tRNA synthetase
LATELTPELIRSGWARDINRLVQERRKTLDLERSDKIALALVTDSEELKTAIKENDEYLKQESLATSLSLESPTGGCECEECSIGDHSLKIFVQVDGGTNV